MCRESASMLREFAGMLDSIQRYIDLIHSPHKHDNLDYCRIHHSNYFVRTTINHGRVSSVTIDFEQISPNALLSHSTYKSTGALNV
jgi:hypothetical protein